VDSRDDNELRDPKVKSKTDEKVKKNACPPNEELARKTPWGDVVKRCLVDGHGVETALLSRGGGVRHQRAGGFSSTKDSQPSEGGLKEGDKNNNVNWGTYLM